MQGMAYAQDAGAAPRLCSPSTGFAKHPKRNERTGCLRAGRRRIPSAFCLRPYLHCIGSAAQVARQSGSQDFCRPFEI